MILARMIPTFLLALCATVSEASQAKVETLRGAHFEVTAHFEARKLAEEALAAADLPPAIVRRYQFDPTPLVRDTARGYRTGHVERVLAGDFDVY